MNFRKTKKSGTISLLAIFGICFIFVILRWLNTFNNDIFVITREINSHITNFTISMMLCTLVGYLLLSTNGKYKSVIIFGILVIIANIIYETILPILNTVDFIDAVYGIVAVVLSFIYLYFLDKKGFEEE